MIVVTGATGKLGRLVINALLQKVPAVQIIAAVRSPEKAHDLAALGVQVRQADYEKPETLRSAFAGAEKVLLISSNDVEVRVPQHQAVVDAAKNANVGLLAYTSILRADSTSLKIADAHKQTEGFIRASGLPFVFLRNGWYLENRTESLGSAIEHGTLLGAAGDGRFASAARSDYAAAAAAVLAETGHDNKIYELVGDKSFTLSELAAEVSKQASKPVSYQNLPPKDYEAILLGFGLPAALVELLVDSDLGAAKGELDSTSTDLHTLIGRPTVTLVQAVTAALKS